MFFFSFIVKKGNTYILLWRSSAKQSGEYILKLAKFPYSAAIANLVNIVFF